MELKEILKHNKNNFGKVIELDYRKNSVVLDFSRDNSELKNIDMSNTKEFGKYINEKLIKKNSKIGIGKYNEDRCIYDHSNVFSGQIRRTIHLGIDLFTNEGIKVLCPYDGIIHSFQNNIGMGDYGPTIILEHKIEGVTFYTLYGHLSLDSLDNLHIGKIVKKGEEIARIGNGEVNGNWPPHLHFEIIKDILGKKGDFPGVSSAADIEKYLNICPNPNIILQIDNLD